MKVIFLDIDGVLNSEEFFINNKGLNLEIDEEKVKILKEIIDKTGAKIVISSSWRGAIYHCFELNDNSIKNVVYLKNLFKKYDISIYGYTPYIKKETLKISRGTEIRNWLFNKKVESFVILDDEIFKDFYFLQDNLVKTNFYGKNGGLNFSHIEKTINILQKNGGK